LSRVPGELVRVLLAESLAAWRVAGDVTCSADGAIVVSVGDKSLRIEPEPAASIFRWMVTIEDRKRGAISLIGVLRQVREALDPGYAASRVRVTVAPLVSP